MERKFFSLEIRENNRLTRIFQVIFGGICLAIAIYWIFFNISSVKADGTLWITVIFIIGFGIFQIYSGFGYAAKFIELNTDKIRLKKNSLRPAVEISSNQIKKIEVYPLKILIILKLSKKILIRFGITNTEGVEHIKDEIISFAESSGISLEIKNEEF